MRKLDFLYGVLFILLMAGQSGCVLLESERYTLIDRQPVEEVCPAVEPAKGEEVAWYGALVKIAELPVAIVHEAFSGLANLADSIGGSIVQVRKGVAEKRIEYKRFTLLNFKKRESEITEIEHKNFRAVRQEK